MILAVNNQQKIYHAIPVDTPFKKVSQQWDLSIGTIQVKANIWRQVSIYTTLFNVLLSLLLIVVCLEPGQRVIGYGVTTNGQIVQQVGLSDYNKAVLDKQTKVEIIKKLNSIKNIIQINK